MTQQTDRLKKTTALRSHASMPSAMTDVDGLALVAIPAYRICPCDLQHCPVTDARDIRLRRRRVQILRRCRHHLRLKRFGKLDYWKKRRSRYHQRCGVRILGLTERAHGAPEGREMASSPN